MRKLVCLLSVIALIVCVAACAADTGDADTQEKHAEKAAVGVEFDPDVADLLDLILNHELADLHVASIPLRVQPEGANDGQKGVREPIQLVGQRPE